MTVRGKTLAMNEQKDPEASSPEGRNGAVLMGVEALQQALAGMDEEVSHARLLRDDGYKAAEGLIRVHRVHTCNTPAHALKGCKSSCCPHREVTQGTAWIGKESLSVPVCVYPSTYELTPGLS